MPDRANAVRPRRSLDPAAELNIVDDCRPFEFPRIAEGKPFLRIFLLPTVSDHLADRSVIVADAIAMGRIPERRHACHKAGAQAAKAAVTERGIRLRGPH